jgi:A/G-specific adenine glycosylase
MTKKTFQKKIYDYYKEHKRVLPWRTTYDPYKIIVSEIMLQQTQSARVVEKYKLFLKKFPTVRALHNASTIDVLRQWQGLGYNRRALMLKKMAGEVVSIHKGRFPQTYEDLIALPGVGPYTARAVMAFAYNKPGAMIETNIRAVFIHFFFSGSKKVTDKELMPLIEEYMDIRSPREWYNALMDYGAFLKETLPNPSRKSAHHTKQSLFKGSDRQIRGAIIKAYTENPAITKRTILKTLPYTKEAIEIQYEKLKYEKFFV